MPYSQRYLVLGLVGLVGLVGLALWLVSAITLNKLNRKLKHFSINFDQRSTSAALCIMQSLIYGQPASAVYVPCISYTELYCKMPSYTKHLQIMHFIVMTVKAPVITTTAYKLIIAL